MPKVTPLNLILLNRVHHCLLHRETDGKPWTLPQVAVAQGASPLEPCRALIKDHHEIKLPTPSGIKLPAQGGGPYGFCFIIETPFQPSGEAWKWVRLAEVEKHLEPKIFEKNFWPLYTETMLGNYSPKRKDLDVITFGNTPMMSSKLAHLVVCGHKRATTGLVEAFKKSGEQIPYVGLLSVVTDFFGHPKCIIETTEVRTVPFKSVGKDVAEAEGEGDLSLEDWRVGHRTYFAKEAESLGISFSDSTPVINEFFKVVQVLGHT